MIYDVIIIGAGPSGLMAMNGLQKQNIHSIILEKNDRPGIKLLLTGGKRCNVTNRLSKDAFIQSLRLKHRKFLYPSLSNMGTEEILQFFNQKGLKLKLEEDFKYFPETNSSRSVLDALLQGIPKEKIIFGAHVVSVSQQNECFLLKTKNQEYMTKRVVIATGSHAYPSTGSSGDGLIFAKQLGLSYQPFTPAETHIYLKNVCKELQGTTIKNASIEVKGLKRKYQGDLLFTHFGLSGPVIYEASEDLYELGQSQSIVLLVSLTSFNQSTVDTIFNEGLLLNQPTKTVLENLTQKRIAAFILNQANVPNKKMKECSIEDINKLKSFIVKYPFEMEKVESKEKAYVNKGGILTHPINPNTLEVKDIPNLYVIGELLDLHGPIGGFNLTIAFSTGFTCAKAIIQSFNHTR